MKEVMEMAYNNDKRGSYNRGKGNQGGRSSGGRDTGVQYVDMMEPIQIYGDTNDIAKSNFVEIGRTRCDYPDRESTEHVSMRYGFVGKDDGKTHIKSSTMLNLGRFSDKKKAIIVASLTFALGLITEQEYEAQCNEYTDEPKEEPKTPPKKARQK